MKARSTLRDHRERILAARASCLLAMRRPFGRRFNRWSIASLTLLAVLGLADLVHPILREEPPPEITSRLANIAAFGKVSPTVTIPGGWFLMGTDRKDDDPFGLETQFDDTEFPQRRIWLEAYEIDRYEVSLGAYLAHLHRHDREAPDELQRLIWHLISVHFIPDEVLAPWPVDKTSGRPSFPTSVAIEHPAGRACPVVPDRELGTTERYPAANETCIRSLDPDTRGRSRSSPHTRRDSPRGRTSPSWFGRSAI